MLSEAVPLFFSGTCRNLPDHPAGLPREASDPHRLQGCRVLVVEDDYMLAMDLEQALTEAGASVVGPVPDLSEAFETLEAEEPDGAILDVRLRGKTIYPLADRLNDLDIPFLLVTGIDADDLPPRHATSPLCTKPLDMSVAVMALGWLMAR